MNTVFDLGGVVFQWPPEKTVAHFSDNPHLRERLRVEVLGHTDWVEMDRGTLDTAAFIARVAEQSGISRDILHEFFRGIINSLTLTPGMLHLVEDVHRAGVPAYVLSNMPADFARALEERYEFWTLFTGIVFSCDVHLIKPDPAIFELLMSRYGLEPQDMVFIDDSTANTETASRLGIKTIDFESVEATRRQLRNLGCPLPE